MWDATPWFHFNAGAHWEAGKVESARVFFRPFRALSLFDSHPRLAPWAIFLRRCAALKSGAGMVSIAVRASSAGCREDSCSPTVGETPTGQPPGRRR